jgi:hypothetical protein
LLADLDEGFKTEAYRKIKDVESPMTLVAKEMDNAKKKIRNIEEP